MLGRMTALAGLIALAACAGVEPIGRSASRAPAPPTETAPPANVTLPQSAPTPGVAAQDVAAPAPDARAPARSDDDDIVVPGQTERQVPPPNGDPRNRIERNEDIRAWDQCVAGVQAAFESDPMRPQLDRPEEVCNRSLGMAGRDAVPDSTRRR